MTHGYWWRRQMNNQLFACKQHILIATALAFLIKTIFRWLKCFTTKTIVRVQLRIILTYHAMPFMLDELIILSVYAGSFAVDYFIFNRYYCSFVSAFYYWITCHPCTVCIHISTLTLHLSLNRMSTRGGSTDHVVFTPHKLQFEDIFKTTLNYFGLEQLSFQYLHFKFNSYLLYWVREQRPKHKNEHFQNSIHL